MDDLAKIRNVVTDQGYYASAQHPFRPEIAFAEAIEMLEDDLYCLIGKNGFVEILEEKLYVRLPNRYYIAFENADDVTLFVIKYLRELDGTEWETVEDIAPYIGNGKVVWCPADINKSEC